MMKSGQEDPANLPMIQKYGCDLWSHWSYVENCLGREIFTSPAVVNAEYKKLLANGIKDIGPDCTIEDGVVLFSTYGVKVRQVKDPITGSTHISPNYIPKVGQIIILCFHWQKDDKTEYIHFAPGTLDKNVLRDPITRGSNTIKNGYLHSLRIYELIA